MYNLYKTIKAWLPLLKLGNTVKRRNELERYSQYLVLNSLKEANIIDFLRKPRAKENLIEEFNWEYPSRYVDDFLKTMLNGQILELNENKYVLQVDVKIEKPEVKFIEDFNDVFEIYATAIPERLKGKYYDYTGRLALFSWDSVLAGIIYQSLRDSALNFININNNIGTNLLDVGCGPGYETADLWLRLQKKNIKITAIDYDEDLLNIAEEEFCQNIARKGYQETSWNQLKNPPTFLKANADDMTDIFEDNSFDVIYFSNFLHWLEEPILGIKEMYRVLKPGGLIFGSQGTSEVTNPFLDITARVVKGTYGFFSKKQFAEWFKEAGFIKLKSATMVNTFKARKPIE
ncbi:MAG: class I SAM-dependent methyltransferase [Candidatus Heimdallarchaeota archaeon]|nr:class I SAM-dependent methyltransferase [Candidatus Heimdallarchaeota archaeon]